MSTAALPLRDDRPICKHCGAPMDQRVLWGRYHHVVELVCTVCYGREPDRRAAGE